MRPTLTVFVSWDKLRQPRFPKEEREQCAALGFACKKCFEGPTLLLVAQQAERRRGGDPCGSMGNGAEDSVLGVLKAILEFH